MDAKIIGENIKSVRKNNGKNQIAFASEIGITQSTLSSYESGNTLPSLEVLYAIADTFKVSTDWLLGLSTQGSDIKTMSDVCDIFIRLNDISEIRYELDIHSQLPNDLETDNDRWYTSVTFYGNDDEHPQNASVCQFLESLESSRSSYESYFTDLESFEDWKNTIKGKYTGIELSKKKYEKLSFEERIKMRDAFLEKMYLEKKSIE